MWTPHMGPQLAAIEAKWCHELFFGGARGGGKSDFLLGDYAQDVPEYGEHWRGVIFRKTYPELEELIVRSHEMYLPCGAGWQDQKKTWTFPNGATLRMRFLERERDADRYQGHQYTWIGFDELTNWATSTGLDKLRACLRSAKPIEVKRLRGSGNPGGAGHQWVKQAYVTPAPMGFKLISEINSGMERMYIPSKVQDNPTLMLNDPTYTDRLRSVGSSDLVRAWLEGDWDVVLGAFFDCWRSELHVVRPVALPEHWTRFAAFDWGSARPFCVGWYAVSDGTLPEFPAGALVKYREWYGSTGKPNEGLKMTAEEVGQGIITREAGEKIHYRVADPAIFAEDGGPSIAGRMHRVGCGFRRADNKRVGTLGHIGGWDQVRQRLIGEDGKPMLYFFSTCVDSIRTIPALQHDDARPEDVNTEMEDHAADETRYACLSRPYVRNLPPEQRPATAPPTFNDLVRLNAEAKRDGASRRI